MKSYTDLHWQQRAKNECDERKVNIADLIQRTVETQFIHRHLSKEGILLEVGCGNGYLTQQLRECVRHVDSIDYSDAMIERARRYVGEINNRFIQDNILNPMAIDGKYDQILCLRVLINLRNIEEQRNAIFAMHKYLKENGQLILIEGFIDGFQELNRLRNRIGLGKIKPASINFYSSLNDLMMEIEKLFIIEDEMHTGMYDFLTRIVYPLLVGENNASGPDKYHSDIEPLIKVLNPDCFKIYGRLRGYVLRKK